MGSIAEHSKSVLKSSDKFKLIPDNNNDDDNSYNVNYSGKKEPVIELSSSW